MAFEPFNCLTYAYTTMEKWINLPFHCVVILIYSMVFILAVVNKYMANFDQAKEMENNSITILLHICSLFNHIAAIYSYIPLLGK